MAQAGLGGIGLNTKMVEIIEALTFEANDMQPKQIEGIILNMLKAIKSDLEERLWYKAANAKEKSV